jgi:hypothetical protein
MSRHTLFPALILAAALVARAPSAAAGESSADVKVRIRTSPVPAAQASLGRVEIFRILQGGAPARDAVLSEHLWRVAGSLAQVGWRPPRVTVRMVVREAEKP